MVTIKKNWAIVSSNTNVAFIYTQTKSNNNMPNLKNIVIKEEGSSRNMLNKNIK